MSAWKPLLKAHIIPTYMVILSYVQVVHTFNYILDSFPAELEKYSGNMINHFEMVHSRRLCEV